MGLFDDLIREKELYDQRLEHAADKLLCEDVYSEEMTDELGSVEAALQYVLTSFGISAKKVLGCQSVDEIVESTLDSAGIMMETENLKTFHFRKRTDWLIAQTEEGKAVVLKPALWGYLYVDPETKRSHKLTTKFKLREKAYMIHRPVAESNHSVWGIMRLIMQLISARDYVSVMICAGIIALLGMAIPAINEWVLQTLLGQGSEAYPFLIYGAVLFITIGVLQSVINAVKSNCLSSMRIRISMQVEAAIMSKVLLLPYSCFVDSSAGRVSKKISSGQKLAEKMINVFLDTSFTVIFSVIYLPQMLHYGPALYVPALMMLVVKIVVSVLAFMLYAKNNERILENDMELNSFLYSVLRGIQKIKSMNAEMRIYAKWAGFYKRKIQLNLDPPALMKIKGVLLSFITSFGTALLLGITAVSGTGREDYIAFNAAYALVVASVSQLIDVMESIFLMGPLVRQVDSLFHVKLPESGNRQYVRKLQGRITLENISFSYPDGGKSSLTDINLTIKPKEKIAIVGESGSGKSTLLKLLLGLEQPKSGSISFDNHSMNSLDLRSLRKKIGSVMQFSRVIPGTLYENISFASTIPVTMEQAWAAAEKAAIADDIRDLKLQMETEISESGAGGFSGGQRQRLLIARALVTKPSVLLLDEATSALDNITQKKVLDAIYKEKATVIMVAHRLSTIVECDCIVVMEKGRIVELGKYHELMEKNGKFVELVKKQTNEDA